CFADGATIPCKEGCNVTVYCGEKCRDADRSFHKFECIAFQKFGPKIDRYARLLCRVLARRLIDHGIAHVCENFPKNIPVSKCSFLNCFAFFSGYYEIQFASHFALVLE